MSARLPPSHNSTPSPVQLATNTLQTKVLANCYSTRNQRNCVDRFHPHKPEVVGLDQEVALSLGTKKTKGEIEGCAGVTRTTVSRGGRLSVVGSARFSSWSEMVFRGVSGFVGFVERNGWTCNIAIARIRANNRGGRVSTSMWLSAYTSADQDGRVSSLTKLGVRPSQGWGGRGEACGEGGWRDGMVHRPSGVGRAGENEGRVGGLDHFGISLGSFWNQVGIKSETKLTRKQNRPNAILRQFYEHIVKLL